MPRCGSCDRSFGDEEAVEQHQRALGHCYCHECERRFNSVEGYEQHTASKHGSGSLVCPPASGPAVSCPMASCTDRFSSRDTLAVHQQAVGHCYCYDCERAFISMLGHEQHNTTKHNFPCPMASCTGCFTSQNALAMHQREVGHCYCYNCGHTFASVGSYKQHITTKHNSPCPTASCKARFPSQNVLAVHQHKAGHCYCYDCDRAFTSGASYKQHNITKHNFPCPTASCTNHYSSQKALEVHQRESGHCYCGVCNRIFGAKSDLFQHLFGSPAHQTQNILYQCSSCSTIFKSEGALTAHLASPIHSTREPKPDLGKAHAPQQPSQPRPHPGPPVMNATTSCAPPPGPPGMKKKETDAIVNKIQSAFAQAASNMAMASPPTGPDRVIKKRSTIVIEKLARARAQLQLEAATKSSPGPSVNSRTPGAPKAGTINSNATGTVGVPAQAAPVNNARTSHLQMTTGASSMPPATIIGKPRTTLNLASTKSGACVSSCVSTPAFAQASSDSTSAKRSDPGPIAKSPIISLLAPKSSDPGLITKTPIFAPLAPKSSDPGPIAKTPIIAPRMSDPGPIAKTPITSPPVPKSDPGPIVKAPTISPPVRKPKAAIKKTMALKGPVKWVVRLPAKYEARIFVL